MSASKKIPPGSWGAAQVSELLETAHPPLRMTSTMSPSSLRAFWSTLTSSVLLVQGVPPRFEARHPYEETFVVAMRSGHPFARKQSLAAFCASGHLLVTLSGDPHGFWTTCSPSADAAGASSYRAKFHDGAHLPSSDLLAVLPRRSFGNMRAVLGWWPSNCRLNARPIRSGRSPPKLRLYVGFGDIVSLFRFTSGLTD